MKFVSITACKENKIKYVGMYKDLKAVQRITDHIEDFMGIGWRVLNTTEYKPKGEFYGCKPQQSRKPKRINNHY